MKQNEHDHVHRHWYYLYKRRRARRPHTGREILLGQFISLTGSVGAGYILDLGKHQLALVAGTFLILPGIFDLGGSVAGALGAKVAHRLKHRPTPLARVLSILHALAFAFVIMAFSAVFLSLFGAGLGVWLFDANFNIIFRVSVLASIMVALVGFPLITLATIFVWRLGADPDNVIGPIETSIFDSLTILAIILALGIVT